MLTTLLLATLLGDEAIRLIVQGDDMGAAHAIHEGTAGGGIRAFAASRCGELGAFVWVD